MRTHSCTKEYVRKARAVLFPPKIIHAESRLTGNRRTRSANVAGEHEAVEFRTRLVDRAQRHRRGAVGGSVAAAEQEGGTRRDFGHRGMLATSGDVCRLSWRAPGKRRVKP
jgi:hypothetical protein